MAYAIKKAQEMARVIEDHGRERYDFSYMKPMVKNMDRAA